MKTNIKLRVTPEQSEAVQKICFANDAEWLTFNSTISFTDKEYLFIDSNRIWCRGITDHTKGIETIGYAEVDADLFIRTNGTCEEFITQQELDNMLNNKSKEDMFKQYGFEVPNFDCTILTKVGSWLIGYTQKDSMAPVPAMWFEHTGESSGSSNLKVPNLTPIKKPWYETCKFPVLVWDTNNSVFLLLYKVDNFTTDMLDTFMPLTNSEIDQLKQDF